MTSLIIDCDPGVDDAIALLFAFTSAEGERMEPDCIERDLAVDGTNRSGARPGLS